MADSVLARVAALPRMPMPELKRLWRDLMGGEPPQFNRPFLVKRLAYRLQELEHGGLPDGAHFKMRAVLQEIGADELASPRPATSRRRAGRTDKLVSGTLLIRDWRGQRYEVTVRDDGFAYQGREYRSLSAIARAITGTQWNGPAFFGLRTIKGVPVS